MGTRHLIAVQIGGQYRIAQYGQWDGYPSGQGATVLNFLAEWDRPTFEAKLRAASWPTEEEMEEINRQIDREKIQWQQVWPELSRDAGAKILEIVQNADAGIKLRDSLSFAAESLMCEWAYVLDLDANTLEVFRGFNKKPLPANERFANTKPENPRYAPEETGYYPVRRVGLYSLDDLPSLDKMDRDCDPPDEEDA